tara:strand:+ start:547 stop:945 length:399 start_codon:yes stop_codon:yes gene_type:complete
MSPKPTYTFKKPIANHIKKCIHGGVSVKDMLLSLHRFQNAPKNSAILYKVYGSYIAEVKAELFGEIGSIVLQQARDGDFKSQEFYLRSRGGWSPNSTVNEVEHEGDPDEDSGAIDALMAKLGKVRKSDNEDE